MGGEVRLWQKPLYSVCLLPTCSSEAVDARSAALRLLPGGVELSIGSSGDPRGDSERSMAAHVVRL